MRYPSMKTPRSNYLTRLSAVTLTLCFLFVRTTAEEIPIDTQAPANNVGTTITQVEVDLDVDSDNLHNFQFVGFTPEEDIIEMNRPGKIVIATSNGNGDSDDLWDYADGFSLEGIADKKNTYYPSLSTTASALRNITEPVKVDGSLKFIPVQLKLVKGFDPAKAMVTLSYDPVSRPEIGGDGLKLVGDGTKPKPYRVLVQKGGMRIWRVAPDQRKSGKPVPAGDFIDPSVEIKFSDLKPEGNVAKLYLEYLDTERSTAEGAKTITANVKQVVNGVMREHTDSVVVTLCQANVVAHKRAKCGAAGTVVPQDFGNFGYETVVIENGDDDINPNGDTADYEQNDEENATRANLDQDDDFVKLTFKLSKSARIPGAKVSLVHEGMSISGQFATMGKWGTTTLPSVGNESRLRFYKDNGEWLQDADLTVADLSNPGNGYFAKIITEGEVSVWLEGGRLFGATGRDHHKMGGALVRLLVEQDGNQNYAANVLVYRGGFLRFKQQRELSGELMTLEFRDGKGRINTIGATYTPGTIPNPNSEFTIDEFDEGELISASASWNVRSGKKKDGSQGSFGVGITIGKGYWVPEEEGEPLPCGHTPPGWWRVQRRAIIESELGDSQRDKYRKNSYSGSRKQYFQGSYMRWNYDEPSRYENREMQWFPYEKIYLYDSNHPGDSSFGDPDVTGRIGFKWDMFIIKGNIDYKKTGIQIHPDGWRDGTAGCIGILDMDACVKINKYLRKFSSIKVRVK